MRVVLVAGLKRAPGGALCLATLSCQQHLQPAITGDRCGYVTCGYTLHRVAWLAERPVWVVFLRTGAPSGRPCMHTSGYPSAVCPTPCLETPRAPAWQMLLDLVAYSSIGAVRSNSAIRGQVGVGHRSCWGACSLSSLLRASTVCLQCYELLSIIVPSTRSP